MTGIGIQPATRITPLNTTPGVVIPNEAHIPTVRVDNNAVKIHGNYATIYLYEKPLQSAGVTISGMTPLSIGTAPTTNTEFTVDYKNSILFFTPLNGMAPWGSLNVAYTGTGAVVDAERLIARPTSLFIGEQLMYDGTEFINTNLTQAKIIDVLPSAVEITGKIYNTYAAAAAYCITTTPSATNIWTIRLHGDVAEAIDKKNYIAIMGDGISTRLLGMITTSAFAFDDETEITDCYVEQFAFDSGVTPPP